MKDPKKVPDIAGRKIQDRPGERAPTQGIAVNCKEVASIIVKLGGPVDKHLR